MRNSVASVSRSALLRLYIYTVIYAIFLIVIFDSPMRETCTLQCTRFAKTRVRRGNALRRRATWRQLLYRARGHCVLYGARGLIRYFIENAPRGPNPFDAVAAAAAITLPITGTVSLSPNPVTDAIAIGPLPLRTALPQLRRTNKNALRGPTSISSFC